MNYKFAINQRVYHPSAGVLGTVQSLTSFKQINTDPDRTDEPDHPRYVVKWDDGTSSTEPEVELEYTKNKS